MLTRPLLPIALCALALASCGGSNGKPGRATTQPPLDNVSTLPERVPLKATAAADPARVAVVRAWAKALRAGDIARASALWALPSKVQNGTPVLTLSRRADVRAFNGTLPCGSVVTSAGSAGGGFTIATFRLTGREGGDCDGAGASARCAILVRGGRIVEWYRLPDDPDAPRPAPDAPDVESITV